MGEISFNVQRSLFSGHSLIEVAEHLAVNDEHWPMNNEKLSGYSKYRPSLTTGLTGSWAQCSAKEAAS
jgi:hypothetical protein